MRDYKLLHGAILTKMAISINVNYQCIVEIILIGGDINIFSRYGTRGRAEKGEGGESTNRTHSSVAAWDCGRTHPNANDVNQ